MSAELFKLFGVVDVNGNVAINQLQEIDKLGNKAGGVLKNLAQQAVSTAAGFAMWQGFGNMFNKLKDTMIGANKQMEEADIGFTTMLGSAEAAKNMLQDLQDFAAKTPFEFPQLLETAKRMKAMGFEANEIIPTLTAVGDAAAGLGRGQEGIDRIVLALSQMRAKGKVSAEEMMQLTEVGVAGWKILADAMGKSTAEVMALSQKGLLPAKEATDALIAGMEKQFPGMMKNMENTWSGITSTIYDNIRNTIRDMTKETFEEVKGFLKGVRGLTEDIAETYKKDGMKGVYESLVPPDIRDDLTPIIDAFKNTASSVKEAAKSIAPVLADIGKTAATLLAPIGIALAGVIKIAADFAKTIADNWGAIKPVAVGLLMTFISYKTIALTLAIVSKSVLAFKAGAMGLTAVTGVVAALGAAFRALATSTTILGGMRAAFIALFGVSPMIVAISAGVAGIALLAFELYKNWKLVPPFFKSLWDVIKGSFTVGAKAAVVGLKELQYGSTVVSAKVLETLLNMAKGMVNFFSPLAKLLPDQYQGAFSSMSAAVDRGQATLRAATNAAATGLATAKWELSGAAGALGKSAGELAANSKALGGAIASDLQGVFTKASAAVTGGLGKLLSAGEAVNKETKAAADNAKAADKALADAVGNAEDKKKKKSDDAAKKAKEAAEKLQNAWEAASKDIIGAFDAAGGAIAVNSEEATLELQNALKTALITSEGVIKAGGGKASQGMYDEINSAMSLIQQAVSDKSGKAGDELLAHLANAASAAAGSMKENSQQAAQDMTNAFKKAALNIQKSLEEIKQKQKEEAIDSANTLFNILSAAIKRQIEAQEKADKERIQNSIKSEQDRVKAVIDSIDEETDARVKAIQGQIDAINAAEEERERAAEDAEAQSEIQALKNKIADTASAEERWELQQELSELIQENEERLRKRKLEEQKRTLEDSIDVIKDEADQKKEALQKDLDAFVDAQQTQLDYLENVFYPARLSDLAVEQQTEQLIISGNQQAIVNMLYTYGDKWKDVGKTFGERLVEGTKPLIDEIGSMIDDLMARIAGAKAAAAAAGGGGGSGGGSGGGGSSSDSSSSGGGGATWGGSLYAAGAAAASAVGGALGAIATGAISAIGAIFSSGLNKYHDGGNVVEGEPSSFIKDFLNLKSGEVPAILQLGEMVIPRSVMSLADSIGNFSAAGLGFAGGGGGIFIDMHDNTFKDGTDAGQRLNRELRRLGI